MTATATLDVEGVVKTFGGVTAVDGVTLSTAGSDITALIGPNGAGKTTLFNLVTGFDRPDSGTVSFNGRRLSNVPAWKAARLGLGRTFQTPVGFPSLCVWDNLMVAAAQPASETILGAVMGRIRWGRDLDACAQRAEEVLDQLGLSDLRDTHVADLSAGDAKLLEFARQLMRRPRMLLLDEPASGVDPSRLPQLAALIRSLVAQDIAILLIDHNLSFVLDIADHIYVMARGRVISEGTPDVVSNDPQVMEVYMGKAA
ncbi:MAG: ABC transporter ATP-binding protein [Solirubrobacteraceae bacterium]